jgi:chromosome segregation ATPase
MNAKNVAVLLAVVCAVLVGGLVYQHIQARDQKAEDDVKIADLSKNWSDTRQQLDEARTDNFNLNKTLDENRVQHSEQLASASNLIARTKSDLAKTSIELTHTQSALKTAQEEIHKQDTRIAELTTQNATLDKQANDLTNAISALELAINDTRQKLEHAEGDKIVLQAELKRLLAEKAELERQFNDIVALRTQLAKLKDELSIARRLEWIRKGLYGEPKGGQRMIQLSRASGEAGAAAAPTNYDLNVEVRSDGSLKVIPPPDKPQPQ